MIKYKELPEENTLWIKLYTILQQLPHKEQVQFALMCAEESNSEVSEAKECIRLVKEWLKNSDYVTYEELRQAAYAAANAAYANAATWSANAAANAARAAAVSWSAYAAWSAYANADGASYATSAAYAAYYAARSLK